MSFLFISIFSFPVLASPGLAWLEKMQASVKNLNYDIAFVAAKDDKVEPWRWVHGLHNAEGGDTLTEYELVSSLNGPVKQVARVGDLYTYMDSETPAFSVKASVLDSPLPEIIRGDLRQISQYYQFNLVGKSRVAGYKAQLLRVIPKDKLRYSLWLWLHEGTGLPLKSAVVNRQGDVLEQIQTVSFNITTDVNSMIEELAQIQVPESPSTVLNRQASDYDFDWQIHWVPTGFVPTRFDRRQLANTQGSVDYVMLSDGLVWFSVYIRALSPRGAEVYDTYLSAGSQTYLTTQVDNYEVTVIGDIPPATAERLAASVSHRASIN